MPDENRVFDVSKPGSTGPHPTSKPVIVGHRIAANDPMVKDNPGAQSPPTHILVQDTHQASHAEATDDTTNAIFGPAAEPGHSAGPESDSSLFGDTSSEHEHTGHTDSANDKPEAVAFSAGDKDDSTHHDEAESSDSGSTKEPQMPLEHLGEVEEIHLPPKPRGRKTAKVFLIILLLAVAGYLFIDSDVVNTGINLPFHVFKQKTKTTALVTPPPAAPAKTPVASIPTGFSQYNITGTTVNFAAPTAWGKPSSTVDKGFTTRTSTGQPDSSYAYVVDFPTNKDVELAVTSSKFLPPVRAALYYDYLQWCTGTNDGKYYYSVLNFTTTDKVDTPSTITCNQIPSNTPTKIDDTTIVQAGVKDPSGSLVGDIYTRNLTSKDLPVFRVKDATSKNADDIKQLLSTVKEQ